MPRPVQPKNIGWARKRLPGSNKRTKKSAAGGAALKKTTKGGLEEVKEPKNMVGVLAFQLDKYIIILFYYSQVLFVRFNLNSQSLHYPSVDKMLVNNLVKIRLIQVAIPDIIWIHDQYRPFRTAIQTTGSIDTNTGNIKLLAAFFGVVTQRLGIKTLATVRTISALIRAKKYVVAIIRHATKIPE